MAFFLSGNHEGKKTFVLISVVWERRRLPTNTHDDGSTRDPMLLQRQRAESFASFSSLPYP